MAMPHFQAPHVPLGLLLVSKLLWSNFYVSTIDMLALVIGPGTYFLSNQGLRKHDALCVRIMSSRIPGSVYSRNNCKFSGAYQSLYPNTSHERK
jgi:hypothetical protein